jgi:hypothetical protein
MRLQHHPQRAGTRDRRHSEARVLGQAFGIVQVFVSGQAAVHQLAQQIDNRICVC